MALLVQADEATPTPDTTSGRTARRKARRWLWAGAGALAIAGIGYLGWQHERYRTAAVMRVAVEELDHLAYPEDPADRSVHHGQYQGRTLVLTQKDETHFDFAFEPTQPHIARIVLHDVDVSLMTPSLPAWVRGDRNLERIALTERQWSRQQVRFPAGSPHLEVTGGDGFEIASLMTAELTKNCLNAGLWEILLFAKEGSGKTLYYQGWFTFPLGHYRAQFERNTGVDYGPRRGYLEHWRDPAGAPMDLAKLRQVRAEREIPARIDLAESLILGGEQARKRRTTMAENVRSWGDFYDGHKVRFAAFLPPGRYFVRKQWGNEYPRIARFERAIWREIETAGRHEPMQELELIFSSDGEPGVRRFLVSGFTVESLPRLAVADYSKGLYMPMGISVPPFFQDYTDLEKNPPPQSPYFSLLLDTDGRWINHHELGVDGPVMHRDDQDPNLLHLYLLSYERHSLVGHWRITLGSA